MSANLSKVLFRFQNLLNCDALEVAPSKNREERVSLTREERAEMRLSRKYPVDRQSHDRTDLIKNINSINSGCEF